ncbi:MAG: NYN domain-containing protein [SAR202 cluster bacterium]|nr:NYN domain-containing protein [SAR202 cluster bacterium]
MPKDKDANSSKTQYSAWSPRVTIFIDGSNLYHSLDENCRRFDLDFRAFAEKLANGRELHRVYYYNVQRDPDRNPQAYQDQQKFFSALYNTPYLEVRLGTSKQRGDVTVEKGVDIMLATDLLQMAWNNLYDVAILVSGDGDFAYAVQQVKNLGKHIEVAAFPSNLAWELTQAADDRIFFTPEYFAELWTRRGGGPGRSPSPVRTPRSEPAPRAERPDNGRNGNSRAETPRPRPEAPKSNGEQPSGARKRFGLFGRGKGSGEEGPS